jgi:hypothetical protein
MIISLPKKISEIHQALLLGIRDYFTKMGLAKLSPVHLVIDSATLALACERWERKM